MNAAGVVPRIRYNRINVLYQSLTTVTAVEDLSLGR